MKGGRTMMHKSHAGGQAGLTVEEDWVEKDENSEKVDDNQDGYDDVTGTVTDKQIIIKNIIIYICFMFFFTLSTTRGILDDDVFYFGNNLKGQLVGVEMSQEHSPTWGKTYEDVGTVEEFYHWLMGPFAHTAFSVNTFDGLPRVESGMPVGYTLGSGKVVGGIRISQLRSKKFDCANNIFATMKANYTWYCVGSERFETFGEFSIESEDTSDFSNYSRFDHSTTASLGYPTLLSTGGPFPYDGIYSDGDLLVDPNRAADKNSRTVTEFREMLYSSYTTKTLENKYPAPSHAVVLPPTLTKEEAVNVIKDLYYSHYVDLHTRAIIVDMAVYNAMLDRLCYIRLMGEITTSGGVTPVHDFQVVRLWEQVTSTDNMYLIVKAIVGVFYAYYALRLCKEYRRLGKGFWNAPLNVIQLLNILFFVVSLGLTSYSENLFPTTGVDIDGREYFDIWPSVQFKAMATAISGFNVFLNWFKFIAILSYSPTFGIINNTLERAAGGVAGFSVIFFIVFYGFAQAHAMVFSSRLKSFRTLGQSCYTLMRSLLGDFRFQDLQDAHNVLGPFLFIVFVALAVFVVLNMLIAIISDAYEQAREELADAPPVDILDEIKMFLLTKLYRNYVGRKLVKLFCKASYKRIFDVQNKDLEAEVVEDHANVMMKEIDQSMMKAMDKVKSNSPSDLILVEWFDSLKQQEEEMGHFEKEMTELKGEVSAMKRNFDEGSQKITEMHEGLRKLNRLLGGRD
jgi:hypothetical protein